jgi:putative SOS response-associated peptidase YedK
MQFRLFGIYSHWTNLATGEWLNTYAIVTTAANEKMAYVHNMKLRMPVLLKEADEQLWLNPEVPYSDFAYPNYDADMLTFTV